MGVVPVPQKMLSWGYIYIYIWNLCPRIPFLLDKKLLCVSLYWGQPFLFWLSLVSWLKKISKWLKNVFPSFLVAIFLWLKKNLQISLLGSSTCSQKCEGILNFNFHSMFKAKFWLNCIMDDHQFSKITNMKTHTHTHTHSGWGTNMIEAIDCLKADFQTYWKHNVRCQITFIWCQVEENTSMLARSSTPSSTMSDFVGLLPLRHYDKVIKLIVTFHINNHWDVLTGVVVESTCSNEHGSSINLPL
jgi:hypothetical protein